MFLARERMERTEAESEEASGELSLDEEDVDEDFFSASSASSSTSDFSFFAAKPPDVFDVVVFPLFAAANNVLALFVAVAAGGFGAELMTAAACGFGFSATLGVSGNKKY